MVIVYSSVSLKTLKQRLYISPMANEFHFPQEIIHHIQSFLTTKESAQTSLLSKSWFAAWSTRPVVIFDENDFSSNDQFSQFSMDTLNRYKRLNLKPNKFVIRMKVNQSSYGYYPLAYEFIISALKLGVSDIDFKYNNQFIIPVQLFASTSLTRLSIDRCVISGVIGNRVLCSRLTSLVLWNVITKGDVVMDILESCPLIRNLDLCNCDGLERLNVSKLRNIVEFCVVSKTTTVVEFNDGINVTEFRYLRRLQLEGVRVRDDFFTKFSTVFPCIEDLSFGYCVDCEEINISSHSLKRLSLYEGEGLKKVRLNVPNISKTVLGLWVDTVGDRIKHLPSLSFVSVSRDCEFDVKLSCLVDVIEAYWFVNLRNFLMELSFSRISLCLTFDGKSIMSDEEIPGFSSLPVVENLTVCACSSSNTARNILVGLSRSCCPKSITECSDCFGYSIWN